MEILYNILVFIVGSIIYIGGGIGLIVFVYNMIRWSIGVAKHGFDPFRGWWD